MTTRSTPSKNALLSGTGLTALLLAAWCSPSLAATGVDVECPESERQKNLAAIDLEMTELDIPQLNIDVADHGIDSAAELDDEMLNPPLTSPAVSSTDDSAASEIQDSDSTLTKTPAKASRVPAGSEQSQPQFRRQMYRTDI